ncbi:hypothetical protein PR048_031262 [Dryococelus australis]|uniref:Uncharacterized protein n=1 Tax=Dryococelus australis TaxID=614101 RepID=A0ABQ9G4R7_9NEOP|nr:hypothetical protein PR048_031262 [Dryococelus australis]
MKGRGKREIPEKTRRRTASSGTIPTCENPATRPGIESGSPWWEASELTARPDYPLLLVLRAAVARGQEAQEESRDSTVLPRTEDEADRPRWLRTTSPRVPALNCFYANASGMVWISR